MKKPIAIFLILIFLLNVMGYYGVFLGLQYKNNLLMTQRLDAAEYDSNQTFEIKIPLTVAYAGVDQEFKRVTGQFEQHGEFYQMVKQKLAHDTLTVVCLKDIKQQKIQKALTSFVKTFTDLPSAKSTGTKILPSLIKDYLQHSLAIEALCAGVENKISKISLTKNFISSFSSEILHPPDRG